MTEPSDGWQNPEDDSIYTNTTSAKLSSISEKTKTTKSEDALSVFSEGKCGEPLPAQDLQMNFTLDEEDNQNPENDSVYTNTISAKLSSILEKTKATKSEDTLSVFSEGECGEPLTAQHLQLNFTVNEEDNEYQQQKCCDFWTFIHSLPQIKHLKVKLMVDEPDDTLQWSSDPKLASTNDEPACDTSNLEESGNSVLDTESIFGDSDCGEPLKAHHIRIDFTPNDDEDNEFVQAKCYKFWRFINSLPQMRDYMVYPEKDYADISKTKVTSLESSQPTVEENAADIGRTAVSTLEHVQEKRFINPTFEAKMPQSSCTLGSREYKELEDFTKKKTKRGPCCLGPTCTCMKVPCQGPSSLTSMVKKMEDWDAKHPKSMDPPGRSPSLQHCILQRSYY